MKVKAHQEQWKRVWDHLQKRGHISIIDTRYHMYPSIQNLADIIYKIKKRKDVDFDEAWVYNKSNSSSRPSKYKIYKLKTE
jgi:aspartate/tyrosine/aromatic aminotransferase